MSEAVMNILDYSNAKILAIINIAMCSFLLATVIIITVLIIRDFTWQFYTDKKIIFKLISFFVVLILKPLFTIYFFIILKNFTIEMAAESNYLKFISIICSVLATIILVIF